MPWLNYVAGQTGAVLSDNMLVVTAESGSVRFSLGGAEAATYTAMPDAGGGTLIVNDAVACFAAGTRIATARGEVAVEDLRVGDRVPALRGGGLAAIVWLGHRDVDCTRHLRPQDVWPVRVRAGAFGDEAPGRDLYLSPDHSVFLEGALIPVRTLVNGATIAQVAVRKVTYWHVELERHDVILAEGLACESYLDTGNRGAFDNAGAVQLHADFGPGAALAVWAKAACAPLVLEGPRLEAARARLLRRAAVLEGEPSVDPEIGFFADGVRVCAQIDGDVWTAELPDGTRKVSLRSRVWVPAHMRADERDTRELGVAVDGVWRDGVAVPLDSLRMREGWHAMEGDWRWTDGDGRIDVDGARVLRVGVAMSGCYWAAAGRADAVRM